MLRCHMMKKDRTLQLADVQNGIRRPTQNSLSLSLSTLTSAPQHPRRQQPSGRTSQHLYLPVCCILASVHSAGGIISAPAAECSSSCIDNISGLHATQNIMAAQNKVHSLPSIQRMHQSPCAHDQNWTHVARSSVLCSFVSALIALATVSLRAFRATVSSWLILKSCATAQRMSSWLNTTATTFVTAFTPTVLLWPIHLHTTPSVQLLTKTDIRQCNSSSGIPNSYCQEEAYCTRIATASLAC
jgi:hypothetical protein